MPTRAGYSEPMQAESEFVRVTDSRKPHRRTSLPEPRPRGGGRLVPSSWAACVLMAAGLCLATAVWTGANATAALEQEARQALLRAATFFRDQVAVHGSYVWRYSVDLSVRMGEGEATPSQGWAQAPGTPAVGLAYVKAYEATGEQYFLDAAVETAHALAKTQLRSGGWFNMIEFDPQARKAWCYRVDGLHCRSKGPQRENDERNGTSLDDDITQGALRLLIVVDSLTHHEDAFIRKAVEYGLDRFVGAQYPNGAWPVRFDKRVHTEEIRSHPGTRGRYPDIWPREHAKPTSGEYFVLNDHLMRNAIHTMLLAHKHYGDGRYLQSAIRAGDFLLAAQMPGPQPGWAQGYNSAMEPMWGRVFEPPAIASWETASTIDALLTLYLYTAEERFLHAVRPAAKWLEASQMKNGLWARFYELETNRPIYVSRDGKLAYDASNVRAGYGFQGLFGIAETLEWYRRVLDFGRGVGKIPPKRTAPVATDAKVTDIIGALDGQGRWITNGAIHSNIFVDNVDTLSMYIAAARNRTVAGDRLGR